MTDAIQTKVLGGGAALLIHAHPTLSEAFFEASLRGLGQAIQI